jgi:hypothetical protein
MRILYTRVFEMILFRLLFFAYIFDEKLQISVLHGSRAVLYYCDRELIFSIDSYRVDYNKYPYHVHDWWN